MNSGELTAHVLTAAYLQRIAEIDRSGPKLNSVIELNPDALKIADALDAERKAGHVRGPLHGIPILLKDNIATTDAIQTTAGSLALAGLKPTQEALLVIRLRKAGAVILGKTNCSEWANYRSSTSSSGWSGRGRQTHNPYALDRSPSGSSSGSAVAVSANLCVAAIGTETNGSIVSPWSVCSVVGVNPTVGLVSRFGIIPISKSQDTAGPITRTVRDAAIILDAIASADAVDENTLTPPPEFSWKLSGLQPGALKGVRIGFVQNPLHFHPRMTPIMKAAAETLRRAGAEVIDVDIPAITDAGLQSRTVLSYEFKEGIDAWCAALGPTSPMKSLADIIAFNETHRAEEMPFFAQELMLASQARGPTTEKAYIEARETSRKLSREGIDGIMKEQRLDALVALTTGAAPLTDLVNGDQSTGGSSTLAAVAGYPSVTVPTGFVFGLPVGLSFFGHAWTETKLMSFAANYEEQSRARREPTFPRTAALAGPISP